MATTGIEWTEVTWNPTTGCDRVSDGCTNCYAATMARRLKAMGNRRYQRDGDPRTSGPGFALTVHPDAVNAPLTWRTGRRVFVNSMSDLFHADVPEAWLAEVFAVMAATPRHTYQVLTKRHARARSLLRSPAFVDAVRDRAAGKGAGAWAWPLRNVWLGVSVENQHWADIRIPALIDTPAAVRFLSCEPLLGRVTLCRWLRPVPDCGHVAPAGYGCCVHPDAYTAECHAGVTCPLTDRWHGIDWVIVGGESGPGARPMHPDWVRWLRDQCVGAGVAFFFKQWGEWGWVTGTRWDDATACWVDHGVEPMRLGKKHAGRDLDGQTWDEYPAVAT